MGKKNPKWNLKLTSVLFKSGYTCNGSLYCRLTLTSLILIFNFSKKLDKVVISKIKLKIFQINLMLELFMCF